jgi:hypothetical protein
MTVRRPKFLRTHPGYQSDFQDAVGPAFKSLVIVAVSAGWAPATVAEGLLALAHAQVLEVVAHIASEQQMHGDPPVRAEPDELPTPERH